MRSAEVKRRTAQSVRMPTYRRIDDTCPIAPLSSAHRRGSARRSEVRRRPYGTRALDSGAIASGAPTRPTGKRGARAPQSSPPAASGPGTTTVAEKRWHPLIRRHLGMNWTCPAGTLARPVYRHCMDGSPAWRTGRPALGPGRVNAVR